MQILVLQYVHREDMDVKSWIFCSQKHSTFKKIISILSNGEKKDARCWSKMLRVEAIPSPVNKHCGREPNMLHQDRLDDLLVTGLGEKVINLSKKLVILFCHDNIKNRVLYCCPKFAKVVGNDLRSSFSMLQQEGQWTNYHHQNKQLHQAQRTPTTLKSQTLNFT